MKKYTQWPVIYLIAFAVMIFLNYWSATNVGIVANQDPAIIQPAGYAFSIWGIIYILTFIWIVRLFFNRQKAQQIVDRLSFLPVINFLLNGFWIIAFTQEWLLVSTIIIALLLINLVSMYTRLSDINSRQWLDRLPFSIYFAWVTVATIVNIFTWFIGAGIDSFIGLSELSWTNIMLVVASLLMGYIAFSYKDIAFPLVFIWSYIAILIENQFNHISLAVILIICIIGQLASASLLIKQHLSKSSPK
ncbi:tryptophan-rich sensory protein [Aerococcus viridans]